MHNDLLSNVKLFYYCVTMQRAASYNGMTTITTIYFLFRQLNIKLYTTEGNGTIHTSLVAIQLSIHMTPANFSKFNCQQCGLTSRDTCQKMIISTKTFGAMELKCERNNTKMHRSTWAIL